MKRMSVFIFLVSAFCVANAQEQNSDYGIFGDYKVVTIRNASDVAAVRVPEMGDGDIIGQTVLFNEDGLVMDGKACEGDIVLRSVVPVVNINDPMLADIHVAPTDSPLSAGDQRIGHFNHFKCDEGRYMHAYKVDDRVLVMPWGNSSQYLILEKPLSADEITVIQTQLKDHKFLEQAPNGMLDEATVAALSS